MQIETAVRRNPKVPDFTGLECMLDSRTDSSGAAVTATFDSWVTERQRDAANIQKQGRLVREETVHAKKLAQESGKSPGKNGNAGNTFFCADGMMLPPPGLEHVVRLGSPRECIAQAGVLLRAEGGESSKFCQTPQRLVSERRRHADPFPLPRIPEGGRPECPRYLQQRLKRMGNRERHLTECVSSLNVLDACAVGSLLTLTPPVSVKPTATQQAVIDRVGRHVAACGTQPQRPAREALFELLKARDWYDHENHHLAPYCESRLAVLKGATTPIPMTQVLGPKGVVYLQHSETRIEHTEEEIVSAVASRDLTPVEFYWG